MQWRLAARWSCRRLNFSNCSLLRLFATTEDLDPSEVWAFSPQLARHGDTDVSNSSIVLAGSKDCLMTSLLVGLSKEQMQNDCVIRFRNSISTQFQMRLVHKDRLVRKRLSFIEKADFSRFTHYSLE
jgi:hypothetical protein